ncbi:MAG: hypothetical protein JRE64_18830 [Deltaproteobacteria bacterium]|nr:hypothetical protein [Deltaproteobacteria bacterium]
MDKIICDASPLIVLAKADLLELLPNQFSEIVVPQAVVDEILARAFRRSDAMSFKII